MNRPFRHTAMIFLSGLFLTGCAYDDTVRSLREQTDGEGLAITFDNGLIDKPVISRATTLLSDHSSTMGVWGWQESQEGGIERLFRNQEVTFNPSIRKWTYTPVKYWESHSTYRFYAYAPHSSHGQGAKIAIDSATYAISIKDIRLKGSNTITAGVPEAPGNFSQVEDIDWMIDRSCQNVAGNVHNEVTFNMQHILAKLSIRISNTTTLTNAGVAINLDSILIDSLICQGDFTQCFSGAENTASEWTLVDAARYNLSSLHNVAVSGTMLYVMESLLIPQQVDSTRYIHIWYNIGKQGGYNTPFNIHLRLDRIFQLFESAKSYVLTIAIGPDMIQFDSGVTEWDNTEAQSSTSQTIQITSQGQGNDNEDNGGDENG